MKTSIEVEEARVENAEKYIQRVIHEGSKLPLKIGKLSPPSWYDDKKFRRGQQFIRENYFLISSSTLCSVLLFMMIPKFDKLFSMTGKYNTFTEALRSHLVTFQSLRSWYDGDIYEKNSTPYKAMLMAGSQHKTNSLKLVDGQIAINQKDLVIAMFAFMGVAMTEYEYFYNQSTNEFDKKKFEGFLHYWRVIGYHIGQMDEFNLFGGSTCEVNKKFEKVFQMFYLSALEKPPENDNIKFIHVLAMLKYWCSLIDKDGIIEFVRRKHKLPQKSLKNRKSKIFVSSMIFIHDKILKTKWISPILRPILNYLTRIIEDLIPTTDKFLGFMVRI